MTGSYCLGRLLSTAKRMRIEIGGDQMIGKLKGLIDEKDGDRVTLDVGGIGYDAFLARGLRKSEPENAALRDAVSALVNLGYAPMQASEVMAKLMREGAANDTSALIRKALKELAVR